MAHKGAQTSAGKEHEGKSLITKAQDENAPESDWVAHVIA